MRPEDRCPLTSDCFFFGGGVTGTHLVVFSGNFRLGAQERLLEVFRGHDAEHGTRTGYRQDEHIPLYHLSGSTALSLMVCSSSCLGLDAE